ncbi:MAG: hypothetical protein H7122_04590, partial [Chitinophagaceae bacterium]|nr:hypothetical protein [Chitinophagaceae bacterium]
MQIPLLAIGLLFFLLSCSKPSKESSSDIKISIADISVDEGNGSATILHVTVNLKPASSKEIRVNYSTEESTARNNEDFIGTANQLFVFQSGETEKKISISILADDIKEGDEIFKVVLSNPVNAMLEKATAAITIVNDDIRIPFADNGYQAPATYPGYSLVWDDEFNGPMLDTSSWTHETGDGCPNICGWGNNELEFYTGRPSNLFFQDGKMIIEARAET